MKLLPFFHILYGTNETDLPAVAVQARASLLIKLAVWFAKSYGPHLPTAARMAKDAENAFQIIGANPASDAVRRSARKSALRRAGAMVLSEEETRVIIDHQLRAAGWLADTWALRYALGARPEKNANKAIAEWPTQSGSADYALFAGLDFTGISAATGLHRH
jgi:hypothetical protein